MFTKHVQNVYCINIFKYFTVVLAATTSQTLKGESIVKGFPLLNQDSHATINRVLFFIVKEV